MKICLFSGAFDPFTIGHEHIAQRLLKFVDQVWILPNFISGYGKKMTSFEHRINMCNIIASKYPEQIIVKDYANKCKGPQAIELLDQTAKLLDSILIDNKHDSFYFALGTDNANTVHLWEQADKLINMVPFIIITRPGHTVIENMWYTRPPHIILDPINNIDISSTIVRNKIKKNEPTNLLDQDIKIYINRHQLYFS